MVSDKQIEAAAKAIYANAKNTDARDIARIALTAAEQAEPAPAARPVAVKPLDLSNLLRHAFISGFKANGGDSDAAAMEWTEYDPNACAAYSRILAALESNAALEREREELKHDLERYISIASEEATRAEAAEARLAEAQRLIRSTHKRAVTHANCEDEFCAICIGGLFICADCGAAEVEAEERICTV